jgi:selT/selW/selH-like putative selenoprotein
LADAIERRFQVRPRLIEGRGGVFEVTAGGRLIFSKRSTGRFPEDDEILEALP